MNSARLIARGRRSRGPIKTAFVASLSAISIGLIALWPHSARADVSDDPLEQEMQTCQGQLGGAQAVTAEAKAKACSDLLASGRLTPQGQSLVLVNRSIGEKEDLAAADLDAATKADPTFVFAWSQSCSFHTWVRRDVPRALQECSKAIELEPEGAGGWTYRGDIYLSSHDYEKAIADYDRAIKFDATWMWPWDNRGEAYVRSGHIDRAIQDFEMVIKLSPDYAMGYLDRGIARIKENRLDDALSDFEQALKVDPKCASCVYGRGIVKGRKGDKAGEAADIQAAKAMQPKASENFDDDGVTAD